MLESGAGLGKDGTLRGYALRSPHRPGTTVPGTSSVRLQSVMLVLQTTHAARRPQLGLGQATSARVGREQPPHLRAAQLLHMNDCEGPRAIAKFPMNASHLYVRRTQRSAPCPSAVAHSGSATLTTCEAITSPPEPTRTTLPALALLPSPARSALTLWRNGCSHRSVGRSCRGLDVHRHCVCVLRESGVGSRDTAHAGWPLQHGRLGNGNRNGNRNRTRCSVHDDCCPDTRLRPPGPMSQTLELPMTGDGSVPAAAQRVSSRGHGDMHGIWTTLTDDSRTPTTWSRRVLRSPPEPEPVVVRREGADLARTVVWCSVLSRTSAVSRAVRPVLHVDA